MSVLKKYKSEFPEIKIEKDLSTLAIHDNDKSITTGSNQKPDITSYSGQKRKTRRYKTPRKNAGKPRNIRPKHKRILTCLLKKLMRFHRWKEASGVLSVLLQGSERDFCSKEENRAKYWAAVELAHKEGGIYTSSRVQRIYDVWTKKNGKMKSWSIKEKYLFQIEYLLYSLTTLAHRCRDDKTKDEEKKMNALREAELTIRKFVNNKDFESVPIANIVVGLIYFELWYMSPTLKEMKLRKCDTYERPAVSETSGMNSYNEIENLDGQNSVNVGNTESTVQRDSVASFAFKKKHHMDIVPLKEETKTPSQEQGFCNEAYKKKHDIVPLKEETQKSSQEQGFCDEESSGVIDDEEMPSHNRGGNTSIFYSRGLQTSLLPLRLPNLSEDVEDYMDSHRGKVNEDYNKAVKHLKCALYSTPPVLASLLPLVQLLLLDDIVEAALEELENICRCRTPF